MSEISKIIDSIIKADLAPHLKSRKFRKKARSFYREHNDRTDVINIQLSLWNRGENGKFTVNLGVYFPEIAFITDAPPLKGILKEYNCTVRQRIGFLKPRGCDDWWEIDDLTDLKAISLQLLNDVKIYGLPWLDKMSELDEVKKEASNNNLAFVSAGIALYQSNLDEAAIYLKLAKKQQPLAVERIMAWAEKNNIKA